MSEFDNQKVVSQKEQAAKAQQVAQKVAQAAVSQVASQAASADPQTSAWARPGGQTTPVIPQAPAQPTARPQASVAQVAPAQPASQAAQAQASARPAAQAAPANSQPQPTARPATPNPTSQPAAPAAPKAAPTPQPAAPAIPPAQPTAEFVPATGDDKADDAKASGTAKKGKSSKKGKKSRKSKKSGKSRAVTGKDLSRLKKKELLQIMLAQGREIDRLRKRNAELEEQLAQHEVNFSEIGSLAQASVEISGILRDAQQAAAIYLNNIRRKYERYE